VIGEPRMGLVESDPSERLSPDDMATRREEEFRAAAIQRALGATYTGRPGVCSNCTAFCLPLAIYCDEDCRSDHEERLAAARRVGRNL
jgi:hypothetical protein